MHSTENDAPDTLPQWLCWRFGEKPWETLTADDHAYWEHEARATRRAVARNGFRVIPPDMGNDQ